VRPARPGKKPQEKKKENIIAPLPMKDAFVNYGYDDHDQSGETSNPSQKMSPQVLLATHETGLNLGGHDDGQRRADLLVKSIQENSYMQNDEGLDTSLQHSAIDPDAMFQGNLLPSNYYQNTRNSKTMT
jgi:hypothetical protein